ncbi:YCF48-related protein [Flavobacterium sp. RSB2_4_14]|uniref:YCF48-related protein n=1 Tax=Flavobacterium sp. RSB2_4_14 TaxID=3447665 RepID=UPI003F40C382
MRNIILSIVVVILGLFNITAFGQGSWSLQTNPVQATQSVGKVQFVSATEGWVSISNDFLLHTINGGTTWSEVTKPYSGDVIGSMSDPGLNISFINPSTGWVLKTFGTYDNPLGAVVYKTTNGGTNWNRTVLSTTAGDVGLQIQFVDASHGWVLVYNMISGAPTFLKTTDGGTTWTPTNGTGIFYFVDVNNGWAYSAGPNMSPPYTIYKTTNGGANWTPQFTDNTAGDLNAIQFTDLNNGWVVGENGKIFHTINGGTNWTSVTNTGITSNYTSKTLYFMNATTGWIGSKLDQSNDNAIILKTTDGGANWITQNTPALNPFSISFWDENNGWFTSDDNKIVRYSVGPYSNASLNGPWLFYRDVTPIDPYNDNLSYCVFNGNGNITDFSGFGGPWTGNYTVSASGAINGIFTNGNESFPFSGQLSSTTDGTGIADGQNWRLHKVANPGALKDKIVGTLTTPNCGSRNVTLNIDINGNITSVVGLMGPVTGKVYTDLGVYVGFMRTGEPPFWGQIAIWGYYNNNNLIGRIGLDDGGQCGADIELLSYLVRSDNPPINTDWIPNTSLTGAGFESVTFTNTNTGYIVGSSGRIFKTIDGGENWTQQNSGTISNLITVKFPDNNVGYAVGYDGTILKTTDGGIGWNTQTSGTIEKLYSVFFTNPSTGYAVGKNGLMLKTTNGGDLWTPLTSGATNELYSIFFTDANIGYVVGKNGVIRKTINGGVNWTSLNSGITTTLNSILFTDANNGYVVGENGVILKTIDAGANWTQQNSGVNIILNDVNFYQNVGYAVGAYGTILKTTDNGTTWTAQTSGVINGLYSICFTSINTSYAVGDDGIILKTTNGGGSLGLTEVPMKNKIIIYPNPNDGFFCFDIKEPAARLQIEIYNQLGQKVYEATNTDQKVTNEIYFEPQTKGVYFIKIYDGVNVYKDKLLIK